MSTASSTNADEAMVGLDDSSTQPERQLRLIASDKTTTFLVTAREASISEMLTTNLSRADASMAIIDVDLDRVKAKDLDKVVAFMKHHDGKDCPVLPKPLRYKDMRKVVEDPWDAEFVDALVKPHLANVLSAANYLGITGLVHLCAAKIASLLKGIPHEKVHDVLFEYLGKVDDDAVPMSVSEHA